jgi:hypothetical protein
MACVSFFELNVVEGNTCNCFCPMWKLTFHAMVTMVSWIASWVPVRLLPWTQCKRWIPIRLMGCVHTHQRMFAIEGKGNPSRIWNVVEKIGEDNWKVGKTGQVVNQVPAPRPKHDKIQARWTSNVPSENMLEEVWWCRRFEMDFWN